MVRKILVEVSYDDVHEPIETLAHDIWQEISCCTCLPYEITVSESDKPYKVVINHWEKYYETMAH